MAKGKKERVKCEGRFHGLREFLYNDALSIVLEDGERIVTHRHLEDVWGLIENDIFSFDVKDPYYGNRLDSLRNPPELNFLSLVPLIESPSFGLEEGLVFDYSVQRGNNTGVARSLQDMHNHSRFFRDGLGRNPNTVQFPETSQTLKDYIITTDVGIGTITRGGMKGGGIRSDSPFLLEVHHENPRSHLNLAAVIGFWAQENEMIVSQMQSCGNAKLPEGVRFGVGSLYLAEIAAREMGFEKISTYCARKHPIFLEHPENWSQFGKDFVCFYDNSAKKLGYDGSRNEYYEKSLKNR